MVSVISLLANPDTHIRYLSDPRSCMMDTRSWCSVTLNGRSSGVYTTCFVTIRYETSPTPLFSVIRKMYLSLSPRDYGQIRIHSTQYNPSSNSKKIRVRKHHRNLQYNVRYVLSLSPNALNIVLMWGSSPTLMDSIRPLQGAGEAIKAANPSSPAKTKSQPWRAFIADPEVRPFRSEEVGGNGILRLKTEKDEHGLGG